MNITVGHRRTRSQAIELVDRGADGLFAGAAGPSIEIVDQRKEWIESAMHFSFSGKMGFIVVPLKGVIEVDDENFVIACELPSMVKNFIGEDKIAASIQKKIQLLVDQA
jgi:hypothetical protein